MFGLHDLFFFFIFFFLAQVHFYLSPQPAHSSVPWSCSSSPKGNVPQSLDVVQAERVCDSITSGKLVSFMLSWVDPISLHHKPSSPSLGTLDCIILNLLVSMIGFYPFRSRCTGFRSESASSSFGIMQSCTFARLSPGQFHKLYQVDVVSSDANFRHWFLHAVL